MDLSLVLICCWRLEPEDPLVAVYELLFEDVVVLLLFAIVTSSHMYRLPSMQETKILLCRLAVSHVSIPLQPTNRPIELGRPGKSHNLMMFFLVKLHRLGPLRFCTRHTAHLSPPPMH